MRCARPRQILWVTYEQLQRDPHATVRRVAEFVGADASDGVVAATVAGASFDAMKAQEGLRLPGERRHQNRLKTPVEGIYLPRSLYDTVCGLET